MPTGKVKWYDADKGFGFLSQEEGEDVYVRSDALAAGVDTLHPRQRVEFDMVSGRRGPQHATLAGGGRLDRAGEVEVLGDVVGGEHDRLATAWAGGAHGH